MNERVLTLRELNRATLARQILLERKPLSPAKVIERLMGMQAQWPPAPYVGIWTRTTSFRRAALERELARGTVLKATAMRQTLHLVTRRDYDLLRSALSETRYPEQSETAKRLAPSVRAFAEASESVSTTDALELLEREHGLTGIHGRRAWRAARIRAHVLHHHETALWNARPEGRFVAIDEPEIHDPTEARAEILRRYLAAFGPASRRDLMTWAMMLVPEVERALARLDLRRFRDEQGRELLDVPRAPLPDPDTPAPVRFLPKWDNVLLAFADRTRILPQEHRKRVIRVNGDVAQTFLVDGLVAGTWSHENGRIALEPFTPLSRATRAELVEEAERLQDFYAD